jgi:hypothetical protein
MQQPRCEADSVFFSASDEWVHATAFPRAFMIALVAGKLQHLPARQPGFRLYGWESGRMVQRGFRILGLGADGFHGQADATAQEEI